jgi:hypothetical protein
VNDDQVSEQQMTTPSRRRFLKAAAGVGVAGAVWAEPIIRGIPAYAADASSVIGSAMNLQVIWSPNRDNWDGVTGMSGVAIQGVTQSPNLGVGICGGVAAPGTTYLLTLNSGQMITLMGVGNPDVGGSSASLNRGCSGGTNAGILSLEPQTGCMFTMVSATNGTAMLQNNDTQIRWINNASSSVQALGFDVQCGM